MKCFIVLVVALACVGCETYIEYNRVPPGMKAVIDTCVAAGGTVYGPILDVLPGASTPYRVLCTWPRTK